MFFFVILGCSFVHVLLNEKHYIFPKLTIFAVFGGHTMISNGNVRIFCLNLADEFV